MVKNKAVFLDRDGVLNIPKIKNGKSYAPRKLRDFKLYPNVLDCCKKLKKKKFLLIVVTNQPDVKKKKIKIKDLKDMHSKLYNKILYDDLYCNYSIDNNYYFRKPNPGMLIKAIKKNRINIKKSFMVGDRWSDIECATKVKCKAIFIDRNYNEKKPLKFYAKVKSFSQAARIILNEKN